jgi:glycerophosphoryl diester phosphodiesterase
MRTRNVIAAVAVAGATLAAVAPAAIADSNRPKRLVDEPIVIGHRGASGYRPEHTLESYELAIALGADYVEPDLVITKDGVLVARHENEIGGTTDVATHSEFADRRTTKTIDGVSVTGWFTEDFTLAELKTLRAKERIPANRPGNTVYDGQFEVPTLQEVIDLVARVNAGRRGRDAVGIYPETKHPTYFDSIGLSLEEPLVATLEANGYDDRKDRVFIQSFEVANLQQLDEMTKVPLVQLLNASGQPYDFVASGDPRTYADMATPAGLRDIAKYADGVGANVNLIITRNADNTLGAPTSLVKDAHRVRLLVHGWTVRAENPFLPLEYQVPPLPGPAQRGLVEQFFAVLWATGLDGLFTDNPDIGVGTRAAFLVTRT